MAYFSEPIFNSAQRTKWLDQYIDLLAYYGYLPWLFGILVIIFLAISVYLMADILDIKKKLSICLIAGLCATNVSFIGAHFYWPYEIIAALPLACFSAWFWTKDRIRPVFRWLLEASFVAFSLGTYGAYTSVATSLVILASMLFLLNGKKAKEVFLRDIEYVTAFIAGIGIYYIVLKIFIHVQHLEIYTYMGEENLSSGGISISELVQLIWIAWKRAVNQYIGRYWGYFPDQPAYASLPQWWAVLLLLLGTGLLAVQIIKNRKKYQSFTSIILLLFLIAIFPLSAGLIYVLSFNNVHFLMVFTFVILYIGFVKLAEMTVVDAVDSAMSIKVAGTAISAAMLVFIGAFVYRGILVSNMAYMRLENNYETSKEEANRVLSRIESCEGFAGNESVTFVGDFHTSEYMSRNNNAGKYWLDILDNMSLVDKSVGNSFSYSGPMWGFMTNVMGSPLPMYSYFEENFTAEDNEKISEMPVYPAQGSVEKIADTIVVKLNE